MEGFYALTFDLRDHIEDHLKGQPELSTQATCGASGISLFSENSPSKGGVTWYRVKEQLPCIDLHIKDCYLIISELTLCLEKKKIDRKGSPIRTLDPAEIGQI